MDSIDIIICTKNSDELLYECLSSIYDAIPVCHLVVVDAFSTDGTVDIINKFSEINNNVILIQTDAGLGKSREIGINKVDTDWFAFIDSDVILKKEWFSQIIKKIDDDVGAIESNFIHFLSSDSPKFPTYSEVETGQYIIPRQENDPRGYTIATLIRTSLVTDIEIPSDLKIYEDDFIKKWIEKKDYKWLKVPEPVVDHFKMDPNPFRDAYLTGKYSIKYNSYSSRSIIFGMIFIPIKFFIFIYKYHSFEIAFNLIKYNYCMFKGLIKEIFNR